MNQKFIVRSIFFIYCLILITSIQQHLAATLLAQDTIPQNHYRLSLSSQDKVNLKPGKVILKGQKGNYSGQVLATGNLSTAWKVLTDYDNFEVFLPNVASSKVISQQGDRIIFEQVNVVDLWLLKHQFKVQIEAIKTKPNKIDFKIIDGDLKKLVGRWQLQETSPGQVLISHTVEVEPGSNTEKSFFYGVYESSLEETLLAMAQEITKRSKS
jgi:ribosome-associated toxin RatA of RatAB toxin-antitoxin module